MKVELERFFHSCSCGREHSVNVKEIYIEAGAAKRIWSALEDCKNPVIVTDHKIYDSTKMLLSSLYENVETAIIPGTEIHADDCFAEIAENIIRKDADILIAVGAGTIHDLTRYTAFKRGIPFISVPTAASVDGFVSVVAAMTWKGMKKTMPAVAPVYVFADTEVFARAPYRLTASGISDLMGKYTALLDWKVGHIVTGEYLCQSIYDLEYEALHQVESVLSKIQRGDFESMEKLMYALLLSGLAMQMTGNSRPASGAEHHISHLIEMSIINEPVDALHGEKVSAGLIIVLEYYDKIRQAIRNNKCHVIDGRAYETELLKNTFGRKGKYREALEENNPNIMEDLDLTLLEKSLEAIADELDKLPNVKELKLKLAQAGCVTTLKEIGISDELKELILKLSPYVRRRLTLLRISKNFSIEP